MILLRVALLFLVGLFSASLGFAQTLFVTSTNGTVTKLTLDGQKSTLASGLGACYGIAADPLTGDILVSGLDSGRITRIGQNGAKKTFATGLLQPLGIAIHPLTGKVYVALWGQGSIGKSSIVEFSPDGSNRVVFSTGQTGLADIEFSPAIPGGAAPVLYGSNHSGGPNVAAYQFTTDATGKLISALPFATLTETGTYDRPFGLAFNGSDLLILNLNYGKISSKSAGEPASAFRPAFPTGGGYMDLEQIGPDSWVTVNINTGKVIKLVGLSSPTATEIATIPGATGVAVIQ